MRNTMLVFALLATLVSSCGLKGSGETEKGPQILTVEFVGSGDTAIQNPKGKAQLLAVPADVADVEATLVSEVEFNSGKLPFTVDFEISSDHRSIIKPEVSETSLVKYYVALDWDSNGDGKQDSTDVLIDFDKQFPDVDISQIHQQVFVK